MNNTSVTRLLTKASPATLSALIAGAFFRVDKSELERLYGILPGQAKNARIEVFIQHHALVEGMLLLALDYWKTRATSLSLELVAALPDMPEEKRKLNDFLIRTQHAKIATIIEAMRTACEDAGISFDDVSAFAEIEIETEGQPIPKLLDEYRAMFGTSKHRP